MVVGCGNGSLPIIPNSRVVVSHPKARFIGSFGGTARVPGYKQIRVAQGRKCLTCCKLSVSRTPLAKNFFLCENIRLKHVVYPKQHRLTFMHILVEELRT